MFPWQKPPTSTPTTHAVTRLFGNENNQFRPAVDEDGWVNADLARNAALAAPASGTPAPAHVIIDALPDVRDPRLLQSVSILLTNAGNLQVPVRGNCVLYADSTNGTDRVQLLYQDSNGDTTQPLRSMVPGRLRRERYFNFLQVSWGAIAGATATIEIYDDPDGALYIQD